MLCKSVYFYEVIKIFLKEFLLHLVMKKMNRQYLVSLVKNLENTANLRQNIR